MRFVSFLRLPLAPELRAFGHGAALGESRRQRRRGAAFEGNPEPLDVDVSIATSSQAAR